MEQLHAARHAVEAHLIRGFLNSHGISVEVRGEFLTSGWGELPVDVCSVWVTDDAQFDAASDILVAFLNGSYARMLSGDGWTCANAARSPKVSLRTAGAAARRKRERLNHRS